ncbi:MAG: transcriptional regulator [Phycisphaerae bacterium]|nr:transcriptional regulator [Phycisphaerae bacterium]
MAPIDEVIKVCCQIGDAETMTKLFNEILTTAERRDVGLRWQLMKLIRQEVPQRTIAKDLGISLCKITRGAKILKNPDSVSLRFLNTQEGTKEHDPEQQPQKKPITEQ